MRSTAGAPADPYHFRDALHLLTPDSKVTRLLDVALGAAITLAGPALGPQILALIGPKNELIKLANEILNGAETVIRRADTRSRANKLIAAHTIVVILSFFDAVEKLLQEFVQEKGDFALSAYEQSLIMRSQQSEINQDIVPEGQVPFLNGDGSLADRIQVLHSYYTNAAGELVKFFEGLAAWERLTPAVRASIARIIHSSAPPLAQEIYETRFQALSMKVPEFALWAQFNEFESIQRDIKNVSVEVKALHAAFAQTDYYGTGLARLGEYLRLLNSSQPIPSSPQILQHRYESDISRPLADMEGLAGVSTAKLPTPSEIYIDPPFKRALSISGLEASLQSTWDQLKTQSDLAGELATWLALPTATRTPLMILGDPGAGKSLLTRMLAARLPSGAYPSIRVELRRVPSDASIFSQIEITLEAEGVSGGIAAIARSSPGAVPVILLDGLDELLQSSAFSRADYLERVREFQQIQEARGVPVAVFVTSRTVVADRVRIPRGSPTFRLEPFSNIQIQRWIGIWNQTNHVYYEETGIKPFSIDLEGIWAPMCSQPLLLLMLALFDADGNYLHDSSQVARLSTVYEALFRKFVRREILKVAQNLDDAELDIAVENELIRLSIAAIGMFNRGSLSISGQDLVSDLHAARLIGLPRGEDTHLRTDLLIGRFFFIHDAQQTEDSGRVEHTYEFLHATFGEYLVARLLDLTSRVCLAAYRASMRQLVGSTRIDDSILWSAYSSWPLTSSSQVLTFFGEIVAEAGLMERLDWWSLIASLTKQRENGFGMESGACIGDTSASLIDRYGVYMLNLVLLALYSASDELGITVRHDWWTYHLTIWRACLRPSDWQALLAQITVVAGTVDPLIKPRLPGGSVAGAGMRLTPVILSNVIGQESELKIRHESSVEIDDCWTGAYLALDRGLMRSVGIAEANKYSASEVLQYTAPDGGITYASLLDVVSMFQDPLTLGISCETLSILARGLESLMAEYSTARMIPSWACAALGQVLHSYGYRNHLPEAQQRVFVENAIQCASSTASGELIAEVVRHRIDSPRSPFSTPLSAPKVNQIYPGLPSDIRFKVVVDHPELATEIPGLGSPVTSWHEFLMDFRADDLIRRSPGLAPRLFQVIIDRHLAGYLRQNGLLLLAQVPPAFFDDFDFDTLLYALCHSTEEDALPFYDEDVIEVGQNLAQGIGDSDILRRLLRALSVFPGCSRSARLLRRGITSMRAL